MLKLKLYLVKGANKLIEEDVKHDNRMFTSIYNSLKSYVYLRPSTTILQDGFPSPNLEIFGNNEEQDRPQQQQ